MYLAGVRAEGNRPIGGSGPAAAHKPPFLRGMGNHLGRGVEHEARHDSGNSEIRPVAAGGEKSPKPPPRPGY